MCLICRESVADLKRYNVNGITIRIIKSAYVGKNERMKEFKKRFDLLGRDEESICVYKHFKPP